ncbi:hypothetical protein [Actinokineospora globicatena]|uniref:hypothetical protein n=1 Tax=Actinokineospora globicatena TaxID=103729 RepID=UPI0020A61627|nr:hypothetical protein [Actinokineospora globicatena]MCP2304397.1 hypothetical protein [Actinokineospora globicatena]GLW78238.1 hypothetical protein Aglo01_27200 [Actinokineospora globicatena]GLW85096.1 hypothetical protein Aglo02_27360 [Actinokineospora globicatena]
MIGVAVLAVAGCTQVVSPPLNRAKPVPNYKQAPVDVKKVLGDLSTLDPCSLFEPSDFGGGKVIKSGSWDECPVSLPAASGSQIISIGSVTRLDAVEGSVANPEEENGFSTSIYTSPMAPCGRLLHLGDGTALSVHVMVSGEGHAAEVCPQIGEGFEKMLQRLKKNPKSVKHYTFPPGSTATMDPCQVAPAAALAAFPSRKDWPAKHTCEWSDPAGNTVRLTFGRTDPTWNTYLPVVTVAGRPSLKLEAPNSRDAICVLMTNGPKAPLSDGQVEQASLALTLKGNPDMAAACAQVTQLAEQIWPVVPPAA